VIILDDSEQEEEVHEEATINTNTTPSVDVERPSTPAASPLTPMKTWGQHKIIVVTVLPQV
jgi:hypothetical protein